MKPTQCEPLCPTHICAEMTKMGMCAMPRYSIDWNADDYFVKDAAKGQRVVARCGAVGLEDLQALVGLANQGMRAESTIAAADTLLAAAVDLEATLAKLIKSGLADLSSDDEVVGDAMRDRFNTLLAAIAAYKALRT